MNTTSLTPAAQIIISIIPVAGIFFSSILIFFAILYKHHENKLRIIKNTYTPANFNLILFCKLLGLCLTSVGFVLTVIFALLQGKSWGLLSGLIPMALGISLLFFAKTSK